MHGDGPGGGPASEVGHQGSQVSHLQRAVGLAHVDFEPGHTMAEDGSVAHVILCSSQVETEIAAGLLGSDLRLLAQLLPIYRRRGVVGHVQHGDHTTGQGRRCACAEIFFVGSPWVPQVDVHINETRQSQASHDGSLLGKRH